MTVVTMTMRTMMMMRLLPPISSFVEAVYPLILIVSGWGLRGSYQAETWPCFCRSNPESSTINPQTLNPRHLEFQQRRPYPQKARAVQNPGP